LKWTKTPFQRRNNSYYVSYLSFYNVKHTLQVILNVII
jgi:hypothetical protein